MKQAVPIVLVIALIGLAVIQYRFLVIGLRLSKVQFDREMGSAMEKIAQDLSQENHLTVLLVSAIRDDTHYFDLPPDSLRQVSQGFFRDFLGDRLMRQGLDIAFDFALSDRTSDAIYLQSPGFDPKRTSRHYNIPIWGMMATQCRCPLQLQMEVGDLVSHLIVKLNKLLIPFGICFLLIIGCFVWLYRWVQVQRKLDRIKNDFINNLTHELKTPVFTIGLTTRLLEEKVALPDARPLLEILRKENEQMKTHINKVLELASLEDQQKILKKTPTDPNQLLQPLMEHYAAKVRAMGGTFVYALDPEAGPLYLDLVHFSNTIHNLLDNAIKYSPETLDIAVSTQVKSGKWSMAISDKGKGIKTADQSRIFDKFFRVSEGDLHSVKGFGLGLSYVRQVVALHGGQVKVDSEPGQGSTFSIWLPANMVVPQT